MSVSVIASLVQVTTTKLQKGLLSLQDEGGNTVFIYNLISASFMSEQRGSESRVLLGYPSRQELIFFKTFKDVYQSSHVKF